MKKEISPDDYRAKEGKSIKLDKWETEGDDLYEGKAEYEDELSRYKEEIFRLQNMMFAHDKYSVLLVFQGMDAAGKDGAISHVMSGINPHGVQVYSFKKPSTEELDHDFMWRCMKNLPERGRVGIFNRSYYEEVLVVKVHPEILEGQHLPVEFSKDQKIWTHRYDDIRNIEKYLSRNGVVIIKFFLHVSKNVQKKRFLERIELPEKNWKFSAFDVAERQHWDKYQAAFEEAISETSTEHCPWYIIPADKKKTTRLIISSIVLHHMRKLNIAYPEMPEEQKQKLAGYKEELMNEKD